jgi:hypothetical protein
MSFRPEGEILGTNEISPHSNRRDDKNKIEWWKTGMMESWNNGQLDNLKISILQYKSKKTGLANFIHLIIHPAESRQVFQNSNFPMLHYSINHL